MDRPGQRRLAQKHRGHCRDGPIASVRSCLDATSRVRRACSARVWLLASMARKLMVIAKDERITNCAIWHKLPRAWTTVYELTKLDDDTFDTMLREGSINPVMTKLVANSAVCLEKHRKGA